MKPTQATDRTADQPDIYFEIGEEVIFDGQTDTIVRLLENDPDGYQVELKEAGTQTFAHIQKKGKQVEGFTGGELFVDKGDFDRTKDASEIYIRSEVTSPGADSEDITETFDICNFGCDDTDDAENNAKELVKRYNAFPELFQMVIDLKKCIQRLSNDDLSQFERDTEAQWEGEAHELLTRINPNYYKNANEEKTI